MQFSNKQLSDFEDMPAMDNQDVKVGGIVTAVEHKTTKTGKPFGSITLEDYSSSYKFSFFGKDYTTYRDFMYEGTSLYITGRVQKKSWGDTNELEYKINKIEYLSDLKDRIKSLSLKIPIEKLTTNIITEIKHMIETNKGNAELRFLIYEPDSKTWVQMHSNNYKVNITSEVLHFLEEHSDVMEYKLG